MSTQNAFVYVRVSGQAQVAGDGFPRQIEACRKYAKQNGLAVKEIFQEEGVSGTVEGIDRPTLSRLVEAVKNQGVKTVLVERADRLARDLLVGELILQEFRKLGVQVMTSEGTSLSDDTSPERVLIRQIMSSVAHFDRACIVSKLKAARDRKSDAAGKRIEGKKPYGTLPGEREVVDRIFQLRRKPKGKPRLSMEGIAGLLNVEGVPTRGGGKWQVSTVQGILNCG